MSEIIEELHKIFEIPFSDENQLTNEEVEYIKSQTELNRLIAKNRNKPTSIYILSNGADPYLLNAQKDLITTKFRFVGVDTKGEKQIAATKIKFQFELEGEESNFDKREKLRNFLEQYKNRFSDVSIIFEAEEDSEKVLLEEKLPKVVAQGFDAFKKGEENSVEVVQDKLIRYMDAGFPLIYIDTFEEDKVDDIIEEAASERTLFEWNAEEFFDGRKNRHPEKISKEGWSLKNTLKHLIGIQEVNQSHKKSGEDSLNLQYNLERFVLVLRDAHSHLLDEEVIAHFITFDL